MQVQGAHCICSQKCRIIVIFSSFRNGYIQIMESIIFLVTGCDKNSSRILCDLIKSFIVSKSGYNGNHEANLPEYLSMRPRLPRSKQMDHCHGAGFQLQADVRFAHRNEAKVGVRIQQPLQICLDGRSRSKNCDNCVSRSFSVG